MNTIDYFYEISKIPRESGNEKAIADYLCDYAKSRNLCYRKDKYNNVIITKYNNYKNTVILQAHTDMVCEKEQNYDFDFSISPLELVRENGYIKANKTTLGADNGIGVAEILNVLDKDYGVNIEAVFTAAEETTMIGAEKINISSLKGKFLINMDGFEEGVLIKESASFNDVIIKNNYHFINDEIDENIYQIKISGLEGGHSGFEIGNNKGNSCIILSDVISDLENIKIIDFVGGTKFNVIPSDARVIFYTSDDKKSLENKINKKYATYKRKFKSLNLEIIKINNVKKHLSNEDSKKFINSIKNFKNGVFCKDKYITTSQNLGVVDLEKNEFKIGVRSSRPQEETKIIKYLKNYSKEYGYEYNCLGRQPGYYTNNQDFINLIKDSYYETTGKNMLVKGVHITLETGFFMEKKEDLAIAVLSAKIEGAHTPKERVDEKSIIDLSNTIERILRKLSL